MNPGRQGILCLLLFVLSAPLSASDPSRVAVFRFELIDSSGEGAQIAHAQRLIRITEELRDLVASTGRFEIVDLQPQAQQIAVREPLRGCNGCETDIAADLGAKYAILGTVYKVSTLILAIGLSVTDTDTGEPKSVVRVGIRGDTEQSWLRGIQYIFDHQIDWKNL